MGWLNLIIILLNFSGFAKVVFIFVDLGRHGSLR
jgi:hypothetical protein